MAHVSQKEVGAGNPGQRHHRTTAGAQTPTADAATHSCAKGNRVVNFENRSPGNLCFPGQPRVFSMGGCLCFLTLVTQGGGGAGRGSGLWHWERV